MISFVEGVDRWVKEFDAAQKLTGEERRKAEAMAASRLRGWVLREYPEDQSKTVPASSCHCANSDECWCGDWPKGPGPFEVRETAGIGDAVYYVAIHPESGICTTGRPSRGEADADRKALNAAYWLGQSHAKGAR